jgi:hypothetical protein
LKATTASTGTRMPIRSCARSEPSTAAFNRLP